MTDDLPTSYFFSVRPSSGMRAFIFPGQGSQYCGMGKDLAEAFPESRVVFEEADEALRFPISRVCFEGPDAELVLTENTQPAILTTSIAVFRVLQKHRRLPHFVAGHSLGEYSALVAAGALDFADAVRLVRKRGRFMQQAVAVGEGAMAAILDLELPEIEQICQEAAQDEVVSAANINSASQIVIAGHRRAVERASELARQKGAKRVVLLQVSAPFHCALMQPAQEKLGLEIHNVEFRDLEFPLVNNVDAAIVRRGEEARQGLTRQVAAAVRWRDCVEELVKNGVGEFVEVGPGKVLSGLVRRIAPSVQTAAVGTKEELIEYAIRRKD